VNAGNPAIHVHLVNLVDRAGQIASGHLAARASARAVSNSIR
jgi:hypothetical protein